MRAVISTIAPTPIWCSTYLSMGHVAPIRDHVGNTGKRATSWPSHRGYSSEDHDQDKAIDMDGNSVAWKRSSNPSPHSTSESTSQCLMFAAWGSCFSRPRSSQRLHPSSAAGTGIIANWCGVYQCWSFGLQDSRREWPVQSPRGSVPIVTVEGLGLCSLLSESRITKRSVTNYCRCFYLVPLSLRHFDRSYLSSE